MKRSNKSRKVSGSHSSRTKDRERNPFESGGRLTLFGRKRVLEALNDPRITAQKLFLSRTVRGEMIEQFLRQAHGIGLPVERLSALELSRISKHGKQDQGVALDVQAASSKFKRTLRESFSKLSYFSA